VPKSQQPKKAGLERLAPSEPAARDEGPRLIPLDDKAKEPSRLDHYLELADSALGRTEEKQKEE